MDDDDVQESGVLTGGADDTTTKSTNAPATGAATSATATANSSSPASGEVPPPKPPRPSTETQRNEQILKEAFPSIDMPIIKAVLTASRGQIEPAFNALLEMTDPEAARDDDNPPPPPPRPVAQPVGPTTTAQSQLEADEMYARRLAEHFENVGAYEARTSNNMNNRRSPNSHHGMPRGRQQTGLKPNELHDDDREHSFLDDDLPVIKEQLRKGFLETQTKVNSWITTLKKKIDETFDEEEEERRRQQGEAGSSSFMGRPSRDHQSRRSAEYDRYDADPELLSDDFAGMKFRNDGTPIVPPARGYDNRSNPNVFRPPPPSKSPKPSSEGRRVAFSEDVEDIDAYNASPRIPPKDLSINTSGASTGAGSAAGTTKPSKWQPLSAVEPSPIADNDPFSLGDSDDEGDVRTHKSAGSREIKLEDAERLRQATADAMADSLVEDKDKANKADAKP